MLEPAILDQLRVVFADLPTSLALSVRPSEHPAQGDLLALAEAVASASPRLAVRVEGAPTSGVELSIVRDGAPTGVVFRGVPGGHELTSLVVAILHAAGKGRQPDDGVKARIRALAGPAEVRTYVSLACTSCPDVVQAANLVALLHPSIGHTMIDGALAQDEIARLGIQGVPAVFVGDELVHSGKGTLLEILAALEQKLGTAPSSEPPAAAVADYDVVVIGGGPAGIAAAIYSARKGQRTAIVADRVGGQLQETVGIENMIGQTYTEGKRLAAELDAHVRAYRIDLLEHRRVARIERGARKELVLDGGERLRADSVIVATGAKWRELEVPGEREYVGRGVAFCPHCDGPFYAGRPVAVIGGGNSGVEAALDLAGIVSHVTVVEYGDALRADAVLVDKLRQRPNVAIVTGARTTAIVGDGAKVTALEYEERATGERVRLPLDGVFVQIGLVPNSGFLGDLVERTARGEIVVDDRGRTSEPGVFAAGDVTTTPFKQIVIAVGEGAKVALAAFEARTLGA
ncbi:MAG: alkyl hydroperoxide reductase subunit F [Myxococcales bacterium]|nr:alkyl hydroperoxide reductase subunit F [Myxococcales bacterium]